MLREDDVQAAAISSATSPVAVQRLGLRRLAYFGDEVGFVTTGTATTEEILAYIAERVAPYKKVRAIEVVDAIPKSPSGKILRRVLVDLERQRAGSA